MPKNHSQLTAKVLRILEELGEIAPGLLEGKYGLVKRLRNYDRRQIRQCMYNLEKKEWVKSRSRGKNRVYELTDLGRAKVIKQQYHKLPKRKRSDGLSTVIIFDIPEAKHRARDFLRRMLMQNNFIKLQESAFIGPYKIEEVKMEELLRELDIKNHVTFMEGSLLLINKR